jgi:hypothetical protein
LIPVPEKVTAQPWRAVGVGGMLSVVMTGIYETGRSVRNLKAGGMKGFQTADER